MLIKATNTVTASSGTEFVLALLQEMHPQSTTIQITSDVDTHVTLEAPFVGPTKTYLVTPGVTEIKVDSELRETSSKISFKGIRLKSDHPVSVYVIDDTTPDVGGYLALPVESLGNEYMILSYTPQDKSELLITSVSDRTTVNVHLKTKSNVTYLGQTYRNGDVIREILDTFETWQLSSDGDLTGTVIKADGKVIVLSGSDCSQVPNTSRACDYIVEQLPTVTSWEKTFVVPLVQECINVVRVISRDDLTQVEMNYSWRSGYNTNLNSTGVAEQQYEVQSNSENNVIIEASRPVLVALFIGPKDTDTYQSCGPSMTIIPATTQFLNSYILKIRPGLAMAQLSIIAPAANANSLKLNNQTVTVVHIMSRTQIPSTGEEYLVLQIDLSSTIGDVFVNHMENFAAIFHGGISNETFAFPLGMTMYLTEGNGVSDIIREQIQY